MDISAYQHINIRMSTRGKRPLRNLTPSDKVRAIQRIHNGETKASVSRDIGVPESTLRGWCKNEQKLRFMSRQLAATDQIVPIPGIENPPEKRSRFDNHIQTTKHSASSSFDELGYNRLSLNSLNFPPNSGNAILEKIALNEIMKKHMLAESIPKQPVDKLPTQMSSIMGADYNSQLCMMQNLNLLSLLSPNLSAISNLKENSRSSLDAANNKISLGITDEAKDITHCNVSIKNRVSNGNNNQNYSINNSAHFSENNWPKDPGGKKWLYLTNKKTNTENNVCIEPIVSLNDSNNNNIKDNNNSFLIENYSDTLNFSPVLPLGLLQIPNTNNRTEHEGNNSTALLEWYKVFNASLNFLALAAAATALQPNSNISSTENIEKGENILYKELTKTPNLFASGNNPAFFNNSEASNDSYFDSEPEDLSVRSATTSKISSSANSRCESPTKSNGSCSPLQSECEH